MERNQLVRIFDQVTRSGWERGPLRWGLPEAWCQAELFAAFEHESRQSSWQVLPTEIPYFTRLPIFKSDSEAHGVKWVDLCLRTTDFADWLFCELKVRHMGLGLRAEKAQQSAQIAFVKDMAGLLGFDLAQTVATWANPPQYVQSHVIQTHLQGKEQDLLKANLHFAGALIFLDGQQEIAQEFDLTFMKKQIQDRLEQAGFAERARCLALTQDRLSCGVLVLGLLNENGDLN